ncbi:MAG: energy-coupling factor transporter transmembrane protein EcfT [Caldibacillus debilis]|jgi:energy-coupling factor transport system permease protein|uniref:ABC-type cobalt transport system, permease component CbiQ and related transporter n=2 Tax=Caldibacillus debilis TaxID=301148 RepID=A0A420VJ89_9BACI|nr:energy-coupling factor transporter transmembrane component T [Caldibacillus debilis]MBO2482724.1 energy-coupling factor transporter transmembrane protein EcfT [Bacillaceae bacterium]KYD16678.1 hypothetical protein B4135_2590 [Caldibacillus debilis]REJ13217.1 MAG: energy-coupling factor transporter transmembrane protein EcfT [Caldibacillus debilis]REJ29133.1 MAG: energy-coupling factor transporter transmembrane protein EcfT [Caldibacillus debilis]REJ29979.1 MAG: energy-coupling factor transp
MADGFRSLHPFAALLYYVFAFTAIMICQHPFFLFFSGLILTAVNLVLDRGRTLKGWGALFALFTLSLLILTPLFNHRGSVILFYVFQNPVTLEAVLQGAMNGLTLFSLLALFSTFHLVIDGRKFLFLFSKWLPKWALLAMLAVRFVPLFKRRLDEIGMVQRGRGMGIAAGPLRQRMKHGMLLTQILLTWSLEDGIQTADSMLARGYGLGKRSKYTPYSFRPGDFAAIVFLLALSAATVAGWYLGDGLLTLFPGLEPVLLYGREWVFFSFFALLIGFPLIAEGKEAAAWRYWRRKI